MKSKSIRILYVTDLHGSLAGYDRLEALSKKLSPNIVINGGDMYPKFGSEDFIGLQTDFILHELKEHFSKFQSLGILYLFQPGNDDLASLDSLVVKISKGFNLVRYIAGKKISISDYDFIGMNLVDDYPFRLKDRCRLDAADSHLPLQFGSALLSTKKGFRSLDDWSSYVRKLPTIEDELDHLKKPDNYRKAIYIIHMPPSGAGLDVCRSGEKVGSGAVTSFILKNQPLLSLHGHIHESPDQSGRGIVKISDTVCIQPGNANMVEITIDISKNSILKTKLWPIYPAESD